MTLFLIYKCLNDYLADKELAIEDIVHRDHLQQSSTQITVGNIITSMRLLSNINWKEFFTNVSLMEEVLLGDPADAYRFMDFDSRDSYRHIVEKISKRTGIDELDVARKVTQIAKDAKLEKESDKRTSHVGYYLVDDGLASFEKELGYIPTPKEKVKKAILKHPSFFLFCCIGFININHSDSSFLSVL